MSSGGEISILARGGCVIVEKRSPDDELRTADTRRDCEARLEEVHG